MTASEKRAKMALCMIAAFGISAVLNYDVFSGGPRQLNPDTVAYVKRAVSRIGNGKTLPVAGPEVSVSPPKGNPLVHFADLFRMKVPTPVPIKYYQPKSAGMGIPSPAATSVPAAGGSSTKGTPPTIAVPTATPTRQPSPVPTSVPSPTAVPSARPSPTVTGTPVPSNTSNRTMAQFGQCVTDAGYVYYKSDSCPDCKRLEQQLGDAVPLIATVNCDTHKNDNATNKAVCSRGYPTLVKDGQIVILGISGPAAIAQKTGCQLPQ